MYFIRPPAVSVGVPGSDPWALRSLRPVGASATCSHAEDRHTEGNSAVDVARFGLIARGPERPASEFTMCELPLGGMWFAG